MSLLDKFALGRSGAELPTPAASRGMFSGPLRLIAFAVAAVLLISLLAPWTVIPAGHRGVVTTFGKVDPVPLPEGIHFIWPIVNSVHKIDVRIQKGEGDGDAASKDLQRVNAKIAINYHLIPEEVAKTFQSIGNLEAVGAVIIKPAVEESVKAVTAKFTAEELIIKRSEVRDGIRELMRERLARRGITIDEFSIVNFDFSKTFNEAIEAKTTAEQLKLKADRDLQRIQVEAEQKIASARAEAEALRLQKQEVTRELVDLRRIENERRAIEKWNGVMPQVTGGALPFIDAARFQQERR